MNSEDINTNSWRTLILDKLEALEAKQEQIKADIITIKLSVAVTSQQTQLIEKLESRIRILESYKDKSTAAFFILQFLIGVGISLLGHFWK